MTKASHLAHPAVNRGLSFILGLSLLAGSFTISSPAKASEAVVLELPAAAPEAAVVEKAETIKDVLLEVCKARGYGEACAKTLLGMSWKESNHIATAVGDQGRARGYFQIWPKLHKKSLERIMALRYPEIETVIDCAEDLRCSADWTISYLESNSYPKYPMYAIQCHNGCNINNGYAASVVRHGKNLWQVESGSYTMALVDTTKK